MRPAHRRGLACVVALAALLTASCSAPQWHRPGATATDLEADKRECTVLSGNTSGVSNLTTSRFVARCLAERGWIEGSPPAPAAAADTAATAFDLCFERCRALTDRSKEECFDTCLDRE